LLLRLLSHVSGLVLGAGRYAKSALALYISATMCAMWQLHHRSSACFCFHCLWRTRFAFWWDGIPSKGDAAAPMRARVHSMELFADNQLGGRAHSPAFGPSPSPSRSSCSKRSRLSSHSGSDDDHSDVPGTPESFQPHSIVADSFPIMQPSGIVQVPMGPTDITPVLLANANGQVRVTFEWARANASSIWNFLTHANFGSIAQRSMKYYFRHAIQTLLLPQASTTQEANGYFKGLLTTGQHKVLDKPERNEQLKSFFLASATASLQFLVNRMHLYCNKNQVYQHAPILPQPTADGLPRHLLPNHGDINDLARVVVLMSLPSVQPTWNQVANESRLREGVDNHASSLQVVNEALETELLHVLNSPAFDAPHTVDLTAYAASVAVNPARAPDPPKSLIWFRSARSLIKRCMGACSTGFVKKTGNGAGGPDNADQDLRFWNYCHGDVFVMFMWLHWDRGNNVPAHCTTLLNPAHSFDLGAGQTSDVQSSVVAAPVSSRAPQAQHNQLMEMMTRTVTLADKMFSAISPQAPPSLPSAYASSLASLSSNSATAEHMCNIAKKMRALTDAKEMMDATTRSAAEEKIASLAAELMQLSQR